MRSEDGRFLTTCAHFKLFAGWVSLVSGTALSHIARCTYGTSLRIKQAPPKTLNHSKTFHESTVCTFSLSSPSWAAPRSQVLVGCTRLAGLTQQWFRGGGGGGGGLVPVRNGLTPARDFVGHAGVANYQGSLRVTWVLMRLRGFTGHYPTVPAQPRK